MFLLSTRAVVFQTEQFVHSLKDELVKNALFALHAARPGYMNKSHPDTHLTQPQTVTSDVTPSREPSVVVCNNVSGTQTPPKNEARQPFKPQDLPHHKEYDEEEWASIYTPSFVSVLSCSIPLICCVPARRTRLCRIRTKCRVFKVFSFNISG